MNNWMVCGTRRKGYEQDVYDILNKILYNKRALKPKGSNWLPSSIIEGCCPDSADAYAEKWAMQHNIPIYHRPGTPGNYLSRNIEMVKKADLVIAFWDGYSYGTAQAIAQASRLRKPIIIHTLKLKKEARG